MSSETPDDSHMQETRRIIREIHADSSLSPAEQARLVREVLAGGGRCLGTAAVGRRLAVKSATSSSSSSSSRRSGAASSRPVRLSSIPKHAKQPSYHRVKDGAGDEDDYTREADGSILGCEHYPRALKMVAPCCGELFTCRFCHDEAVTDHKIDRYAVEQVVCMRCWTLQPFGKSCIRCLCSFGRWNCSYCRFVDDTPSKHIFHCSECKMCRVGSSRPEDFKHCKVCDACVPIEHVCISGCAKSKCPICFEDLFTSVRPSCALHCGHLLHVDCQQEYLAAGHERCPLCLKTVLCPEKAKEHWNQVRAWVDLHPMPPEFDGTEIDILCNDCCRTNRVKFNFYGVQCPVEGCHSFNTNQLNCYNWPRY